MIWEPFALALVLGLVVSAGIYFAFLWPAVEPIDEDEVSPPPEPPPAPEHAGPSVTS